MGKSWNDRYASGEASDYPPEQLVIETVRLRTPGRALDLACGLGRHSVFLAAQGWDVVAVDSSRVALDILSERAAEGLAIHPVLADLEAEEFFIEPDAWDLIVDCCYLQRSLFPSIRDGIKIGGIFVGVFPMEGINPAYCLKPGEGRGLFNGWEFLDFREGDRTEMVVRKPQGFAGERSQAI
jgi:tellurite methyltransferase